MNTFSKQRSLQLSSQRGAAAVELALVALPMILMAVAAVEYARLMFTYETLLKGVREGARYMSTVTPTALGYNTYVTTARNRVLYGDNTVGGTPVAPGLTSAMICIYDRVTPAPAGCGAYTAADFGNIATGGTMPSMNAVRVEIRNYSFQSSFPLTGLATTFEPIAVTMMQK